MKRKTKGTTTVEFAVIAALFFTVLLAVIEFGRALYVWNTLTEATRRGARIAVVCPRNHSAIARIAVFNNATAGGASPILAGLSPANIVVSYLDINGAPGATFAATRYVRVRITGYQHNVVIPFFNQLWNAPAYETTLPRESLGVPRVGAGPQCFGTAT